MSVSVCLNGLAMHEAHAKNHEQPVGPTAYFFMSDEGHGSTVLSMRDPKEMRKIANKMLELADELEEMLK